MALVELKVISIKELLGLSLCIPIYQRPYRWSNEAVNMLFDDILFAMHNNPNNEYRLGSVILHQEGDKNNIVDGQQRITTLAIMLNCLSTEENRDIEKMLELNYTDNSIKAIVHNYELIKSRVSELKTDGERGKYLTFLLNQCSLVKIVTDDQSEAFQFFDSQNSRGKELAPHDLLKAYHLREMGREDERTKIEVIKQWEDYGENELKDLFSNHLYPTIQWYRGKDGLNYSSAKIKQFKGVKIDFVYDYVLYHKASNLFIEKMNEHSEEFNRKEVNQFQLTQKILAGTRFFKYVSHYIRLLKEINIIIEEYCEVLKIKLPSGGNGDLYTKRLFQNILMFFADKFGIESITEQVFKRFLCWSYSIRISMYAVYEQTINNYALGRHDKNVNHINIFEMINEMIIPNEINMFIVNRPDAIDKYIKEEDSKYGKLYDVMQEYCGWSEILNDSKQ